LFDLRYYLEAVKVTEIPEKVHPGIE